jgi:NAD+ synthase (glutamine-hydrolysing)
MVMPKVRLALAQTNPIVGDLESNINQIIEVIDSAIADGANLIQFGEMAITGYPIEDLATRPAFVQAAEAALGQLVSHLQASKYADIAVVLGLPTMAARSNGWATAHNSAVAIVAGRVVGKYNKFHLPNYSVFDEFRNFVPGEDLLTFTFNGLTFSVVICEDIWQSGGPVSQISANHTDVTLVLNGSPFEREKDDRRFDLISSLALEHDCAVSYVNLVGGQDDLVFDGDSMIVNSKGSLAGRSVQFERSIYLVDIDAKDSVVPIGEPDQKNSDDLWQVWNALVLGLRDYVDKNNFKSVILGLSGGIDSALCASIAVDAIGNSRVFGVSMPSDYSSDHSKSDAFDLAERLQIDIRTEAIASMVDAFESQLNLSGLASENLQARMRGVILMALSNQEGHLTLTTGNKTELAVGYSTIYGDSVGGFAPIKDIEKTLVWKLALWRNEQAARAGQTPPIPENSISKPPSAELRPGQVDQDTLPEYELLDEILENYVEKKLGLEQIVSLGFDAAVVNRILSLVDRAEWKRRQGAIGPKITGMAFGRDRRLPITNKYL